MKKEMYVAEEVFITLRELSKSRGYTFRWSQARMAYSSIYGKKSWRHHSDKSGFNMTLGNMLRAQIQGGVIARLSRGLYVFLDATRIARPLYVSAGSFKRPTFPYWSNKSVSTMAPDWHLAQLKAMGFSA